MKINIDNLVQQLIPPHKRKKNRLSLLRSFVSPLKGLFDEYDKWRTEARILFNVNSQMMVLEGYLRMKFNEPIAIKIISYDDQLLDVGLLEEGEGNHPSFDLIDGFVSVPLIGEIRERFDDVDFVVFIPDYSLEMQAAVRVEIEKYKQALTRYKLKIK